MPTTGMDLKLQRVGAMVALKDLAARMERSRATIHRYEGLRVIPEDVARTYLEALATFQEVSDRPEAA